MGSCLGNTTVDPVVNIHPSFQHGSKKYYPFCGRGPHVRTVAHVIGSVEIISCTLLLIWSVMGFVFYNSHHPWYERVGTTRTNPCLSVYCVKNYTTFTEYRFVRHDPSENVTDTQSLPFLAGKLMNSYEISGEMVFACVVISSLLVYLIVGRMFCGIRRGQPKRVRNHMILQFLFGVSILIPLCFYAFAPIGYLKLELFPNRWWAVAIFGTTFVANFMFAVLIYRLYLYVVDKRSGIILAIPQVPRDDMVTTVI